MKYTTITITTIFLLFQLSCKEEVLPEIVDTAPTEEREYELGATEFGRDIHCVVSEAITYQDSSFLIYDKGAQTYGSAQAVKLNKDWEASALAAWKNNGNLIIGLRTYHTDEGFHLLRESFSVELSHPIEGCFEVQPFIESETFEGLHCIANYHTDDIDVIITSYISDLEDSKESYVEITHIDLDAKEVSGQFMISFKKDPNDTTTPDIDPEYVRFFNGTFSCEIIN